MNNEPVAWIDPKELDMDVSTSVTKNKQFESDIPLYTHPVKEQDTDCQYCKQGCIRCDARKQLTDEEIVNLYKETEADNGGIREFARAILRKAQNG
jgi:hypothetical protein